MSSQRSRIPIPAASWSRDLVRALRYLRIRLSAFWRSSRKADNVNKWEKNTVSHVRPRARVNGRRSPQTRYSFSFHFSWVSTSHAFILYRDILGAWKLQQIWLKTRLFSSLNLLLHWTCPEPFQCGDVEGRNHR
jgi:hypothetical protein